MNSRSARCRDEEEEDHAHRARFTGKGICPACGSQPWRVNGSRCYKCRLRYAPEQGVEEQARALGSKDHQWSGFY